MKTKEKKNGTPVVSSRKSPRFYPAESLRPATRLSCANRETRAPDPSLELPKRKRTMTQFTENQTETDDSSLKDAYQLDGRMDAAARAKRFQYYLKRRLKRFKTLFLYGPDKEQRTCILSSGETFDWTDNSSGTTWVAIHGTTPYCVVAMDSWPERNSLIHGSAYHPPVHVVLRTVLDQISDTSSALREKVSQKSQAGPFAIVSVAPGTVDDDQETSRKAHTRAVNFLISKLKDRADLTLKEIVKIGVCALMYQFGSKFQSNQLQAFYYDGVSWDGSIGKVTTSLVDEYLNDLNETSVDDHHLAAANNIKETTGDHLATTVD